MGRRRCLGDAARWTVKSSGLGSPRLGRSRRLNPSAASLACLAGLLLSARLPRPRPRQPKTRDSSKPPPASPSNPSPLLSWPLSVLPQCFCRATQVVNRSPVFSAAALRAGLGWAAGLAAVRPEKTRVTASEIVYGVTVLFFGDSVGCGLVAQPPCLVAAGACWLARRGPRVPPRALQPVTMWAPGGSGTHPPGQQSRLTRRAGLRPLEPLVQV